MRLGRKLAEGFAVDHEADRAAAGGAAPVPEPTAPGPELIDTDRPEPVPAEPARSGPRSAH